MSRLLEGPWARVAAGAGAVVLAVAGAALSAAIASGGGRAAGAAGVPPRPAVRCGAGIPKVTVTGRGVVPVTPDLLTMSLDVHASGSTASSALAADDAATTAVLRALSSGGLATRDLQTADLTIQPEYAATGGAVTGYAVDDTVVARVTKLSGAGALIDAAVAAGGNDTRIDSLTFSLAKPLGAQRRARAEAVRQAVGHATAIAASAGRRLGGICSIHDVTVTSTTTPVPPPEFSSVGVAAPRVPLQAGSEVVTSRVTVVFALD